VDDSDTFQPVPARLPGAAHGNPDLPSTISLKWASTIAEIRTRLADGIPGLQLNGHPELRLPNTLHVSFPGVSGRSLLAQVADRVAASVGSACLPL